MKILHTSDWHIGRRFEREPLDADQQGFLEWLATRVEEHGVDLVIVAGDVFDRSLPAEDAVGLLDAGIDGLRAAGATVALIPGNHDSARRLGFGARRQALAGVHVFADDQGPPVPWLFESDGDAVVVVAVPYLDPLVVPAPGPGAGGAPPARTHGAVLAAYLDAGRKGLASYAAVPSVAVAHANVVGGLPSDSEKALTIGGADAVAASVFEGFDYVALGHLHRPQDVGGDARVAYSGSPLPYSFSEDHAKSVRLVELGAGTVTVTEHPVPVGRPVATIEGPLEQLLCDPAHDALVDHWVAARLTDRTAQVEPLERLRSRFPHAVSVRYSGAGTPGGAGGWGVTDGPRAAGRAGGAGADRPVEDVVLDFLEEVRGLTAEAWARELVEEAVRTANRVADG